MDKINFQNLPNQTTPINATNLNQMQTNADKIDVLRSGYTDLETNANLNNITIPRNI